MPFGCRYRVAVTVDHTKVATGGLSNYDLLLTAASLPTHMLAHAIGADIRATSDSAGTTQLACDVAWFEPDLLNLTLSDVVIRINIPSLSDSSDTVIYVWYGNASATLPAASDTYGQHAAYDADTLAYWPLEEDPSGSAPQMLDRTSSAFHGTSAGSMTSGESIKSQVSRGLDFDGSDDRLACADPINVTALTLSFWAKANHTDFSAFIMAVASNSGADPNTNGGMYCAFEDRGGVGTKGIEFAVGTASGGFKGGVANNIIPDGTWESYACTWAGSSIAIYAGGVSQSVTNLFSSGGSGDIRTSSSNMNIAAFAASTSSTLFNGVLDEVRIESAARSAGWILTRYNNESDPGSFVTAGTPDDLLGGSVKVPWHLLLRRAI